MLRRVLNILSLPSLLLALWFAWTQIENYNTSDGGFAVKDRTNPVLHRAYYDLYVFDFPVPYWYGAATASLLPLAWLAMRMADAIRLAERRRMTLCQRCGYDLRATPDRCPECGTEKRANT